MGFGHGPYGYQYGIPYPTPTGEVRSDLSSSRKVDAETRRYVLNEQGGFEPMDDVDQRVLLTVSFALLKYDVITSRTLRSEELALRKALADAGLSGGRQPAIKLLRVTCERVGSTTVVRTVAYQNLLANTQRTLKA